MKNIANEHVPVLVHEIIDYLAPLSIAVFFEGTVGLGGHAEAILKHHPEISRYIACDQDIQALEKAKVRLMPYADKITWAHANFQEIQSVLRRENVEGIDLGLFDIGVSSMQLDQPERGFSFRKVGPLDMRMDQSQGLKASDVVNTYSEKELIRILKDYGEVSFAKKLAAVIVEMRKKKPFKTTGDLVEAVEKLFPRQTGKTHPATCVFQAVRIEVNQELDVLKTCLEKSLSKLNLDGSLMVISFHSLEDRIVKEAFKEAALPLKNERGQVIEPARFEIVTKKPITAGLLETKKNPRARSAKLRIIKRII